ncbi:MAG: response regulator [Geminicoccaceae bacterium]|nr:response regulator [Geminicoccaceae bacterium]MDW8340314.1 response regulator [Geminicoccaceae bacterium]
MTSEAPSGRTRGTPMRVLLVDDDPALRRNLARALEREGFSVFVAASLSEAFRVAADHPPDCAVLDLNLEDGYGLQLLESLKELRPGCRIVVLTGYDSIASTVVALKAGVAHYLAKPVPAEKVIAALRGDLEEAPAVADQPMSADRVRWEYIQRIFEQCNRNVSETARRLNMHRRTLQRILAKRAPR